MDHYANFFRLSTQQVSRESSDDRSWTNSAPPIQRKHTYSVRGGDIGKSLVLRNEALAKELGRIKELNRRQKETIQQMMADQLNNQPKIMLSVGTQTEYLIDSSFQTPRTKLGRPIFRLLEGKSTRSLDKGEGDTIAKSHNRLVSEWMESPLSLSARSKKLIDFSPTAPSTSPNFMGTYKSAIRKSNRTPLKVSYQEPSLRVKMRKGFNFFPTEGM